MNKETAVKWELFRQSGLLWWINMILHTFGYAIVIKINQNNEIIEVYPTRTSVRGFSEENNTRGYEAIASYMKTNADVIYEDTVGDDE